MHRFTFGLIVFFLICLSLGAHSESLVIATYRDGSITNEDLRFHAERHKSPLEMLDLSAEQFPEAVERSRERIENAVSDLAFFELLSRERISERPLDATESYQVHAELRRYIVHEYFPAKLQGEIEISASEVEQYYRRHPDEFKYPEQVKIAFIFRAVSADPEAREPARQLLQELMAREDFAQRFEMYARAYSQSPSAQNGGVVDYFPRGKYSPEIEKVAFGLDTGAISEIVEREKGLYVIKCLDHKFAGQKPLSEVEWEIRELLFTERLEKARTQLTAKVRERGDFDLWRQDEKPAPADIVVRSGDVSITRAILEANREWSDSLSLEALQARLQSLLEEELLYQGIVESASKSDPQLTRNLNLLRAETLAIEALQSRANKEIRVEEKEIRAFWEGHRNYYHTDAAREIEYLLFAPQEDTATKEEQTLALQRLGEKARQFYDRWMKIPQSQRVFEAWAAEVIHECSGVQRKSLGMVTRLPGDWSDSRAMSELGVGYLSAPIQSKAGIVLYYVQSEGKPRILTYEEARDKAASVVRHRKYTEFRNTLRTRMLERGGFKFAF